MTDQSPEISSNTSLYTTAIGKGKSVCLLGEPIIREGFFRLIYMIDGQTRVERASP